MKKCLLGVSLLLSCSSSFAVDQNADPLHNVRYGDNQLRHTDGHISRLDTFDYDARLLLDDSANLVSLTRDFNADPGKQVDRIFKKDGKCFVTSSYSYLPSKVDIKELDLERCQAITITSKQNPKSCNEDEVFLKYDITEANEVYNAIGTPVHHDTVKLTQADDCSCYLTTFAYLEHTSSSVEKTYVQPKRTCQELLKNSVVKEISKLLKQRANINQKINKLKESE